MFDEISAELQKAGHHITRYAHRDAFAVDARSAGRHRLLLCVAMFPLTRAMLAAAPRLRAIVSAVTGVDGIDIAAATERTVVIANAQTEENIIGMAEATVLMMLAALYDLDGAQNQVRQKLWRPPQLKASQLRGKTIGLVGLGRSAARPRGCWRRGARPCNTARAATPISPGCRRCRGSISTRCCAPATSSLVLASLNPETRGLIGAEQAAADEADRDPGQHRARRHRRRGGARRRAQEQDHRRRGARLLRGRAAARRTARCAGCRT